MRAPVDCNELAGYFFPCKIFSSFADRDPAFERLLLFLRMAGATSDVADASDRQEIKFVLARNQIFPRLTTVDALP